MANNEPGTKTTLPKFKAATVLLVCPLRIGDALLMTPLIRSIKKASPDTQIDFLTFKSSEGAVAANPDLRKVISLVQGAPLREQLAIVKQIFRRYDVAITPLLNDRSMFYVWAAGARRVGFRTVNQHFWKRWLLNDWALLDITSMHTVRVNLLLADLLGIPRDTTVVSAWTENDEKNVQAVLPFALGQARFAVIHAYPKFPYKMWPQQNWIELVNGLAEKGLRVVLTGGGGSDEMAYVEKIAAATSAINLAGKLALSQIAYLLSHANLYVGPDTSVTHFAAAAGTPTVALFGPTNPVKWGPWPKGFADKEPFEMKGSQRIGNVYMLQGEGACVPCSGEGCDKHINSRSECLDTMSTARVMAACDEMLAKPGYK
jgi:heptosyltransferase III